MITTDKQKVILFFLALGMNKKELIDAIASGSKLTKADAGRIFAGMPSKIDAAKLMALIDAIAASAKLTKADAGRMMAKMTRKKFDEFLIGNERAVIIDAISAGAKLTKADAGRALDATIESIHKSLNKKLKTVFGG